jgi:molybdopterin-containing oxidoreductase family iron-sulfur binding subunit
MGDGQQANNPWLQEFPDPIMSWDNYVTVSNADAKLLEMSNEIVANGGLNLTTQGLKLDNVPVIVQPGQAVGTIGWLGCGHFKSGFERRDASRFKCLRFI